jgi:hypothetical protein
LWMWTSSRLVNAIDWVPRTDVERSEDAMI